LKKWFSNTLDVTEYESTVKSIPISDSESTKTLGISGLINEDAFKFQIVMGLRTVTSKLFDPLGLLSPIVVRGNIPFAGTLAK